MLAESLYVLGCDVMLEKINIDILQAAGTGESGRAPAPCSLEERHSDAGAASGERGADAPGTSTSSAPSIPTLTTREDGVFEPL